MEIKDIRFSHAKTTNKSSGAVALCSVNIDNKFIIHGVKVEKVSGMLKVKMPERPVGISEKMKPVVTVFNHDFKNYLSDKVLQGYYAELAKQRKRS